MNAGPKTLTMLRIADLEIQSDKNAATREFRRGQLKAMGDSMHVLNLAIAQCRSLRQPTSQLEEVREALRIMLLAI
jgi:hypothetical protein